ncbi:hypothetical protein C1645_791300 [Glomus cerebriforme]|uniref:Uncharacterized protein n=1 Tax=Glomus cerebriforme TaxID=658196 RepID=A0A397S3U3_9GLOM|nr:hypothetical protein C1645_791300 [Glomus cerebriforme]
MFISTYQISLMTKNTIGGNSYTGSSLTLMLVMLIFIISSFYNSIFTTISNRYFSAI